MDVLSVFRSREIRRPVDNGRVRCPNRDMDVEIDICAGCASMTEMVDVDKRQGYVRCTGAKPQAPSLSY